MKNKIHLKNVVIFVTCVLVFSGCVKAIKLYHDTSRKDDVILRFAVTSGTYVYDETDNNLKKYIDKVYSYAKSQENSRVDAIIVNGNLTADGSKEAFDFVEKIEKEYLKDGTQFFYTTGEADFSMEDEGNVKTYVLSHSSDFAVNVNGYNFLFWSPIYNSYATKFQWLDQTLSDLTKYNDRPVFVFQYAVLKDTTYGSDNWYTYESEPIMEILEKYPTVINFSSAALAPANLKTSIYQKCATYVNTGALRKMKFNYNQFGMDASAAITGSHIDEASQCRIIEVYGDGRVLIRTMDVNTGKFYNVTGENTLEVFYPGKQESYIYTDEKNVSDDIPRFEGEISATKFQNDDGRVGVEFSKALDNDEVLLYEVTVYDENESEIVKTCIYSDIALYEKRDTVVCTLADIDINIIKSVKIVPYDVFGVFGEPYFVEINN